MLKISTLFLSLLVCCGVAFADLVICGKCGYENPKGSKQCVHCKADLPDSDDEKEEPPPKVVAARPGIGFLDGRIVEKEIALGDKYRKMKKLGVARLIYRNAAALDMLADPEDGNKRATRIVESIKKTATLGKTFRRPCPVCNGSGKARMLSQTFTGKTSYREVAGRPCRNCYGTGFALGVGTLAERTAELGRSAREYVQIQRGRKFVPVGEAWVPMSLEGKLSDREKALLMRTVAAPCKRCMGLGLVDCRKCKGTGRVECTAPGCVRGMVESEMKGGLMKTGVRRRTKCKVCGGRGTTPCTACGGRGSVLCEECRGTGERAPCSKCAGQGTVVCPGCKGSGRSKDGECPECGGTGAVLCGSCNGDGRER